MPVAGIGVEGFSNDGGSFFYFPFGNSLFYRKSFRQQLFSSVAYCIANKHGGMILEDRGRHCRPAKNFVMLAGNSNRLAKASKERRKMFSVAEKIEGVLRKCFTVLGKCLSVVSKKKS